MKIAFKTETGLLPPRKCWIEDIKQPFELKARNRLGSGIVEVMNLGVGFAANSECDASLRIRLRMPPGRYLRWQFEDNEENGGEAKSSEVRRDYLSRSDGDHRTARLFMEFAALGRSERPNEEDIVSFVMRFGPPTRRLYVSFQTFERSSLEAEVFVETDMYPVASLHEQARLAWITLNLYRAVTRKEAKRVRGLLKALRNLVSTGYSNIILNVIDDDVLYGQFSAIPHSFWRYLPRSPYSGWDVMWVLDDNRNPLGAFCTCPKCGGHMSSRQSSLSDLRCSECGLECCVDRLVSVPKNSAVHAKVAFRKFTEFLIDEDYVRAFWEAYIEKAPEHLVLRTASTAISIIVSYHLGFRLGQVSDSFDQRTRTARFDLEWWGRNMLEEIWLECALMISGQLEQDYTLCHACGLPIERPRRNQVYHRGCQQVLYMRAKRAAKSMWHEGKTVEDILRALTVEDGYTPSTETVVGWVEKFKREAASSKNPQPEQ